MEAVVTTINKKTKKYKKLKWILMIFGTIIVIISVTVGIFLNHEQSEEGIFGNICS